MRVSSIDFKSLSLRDRKIYFWNPAYTMRTMWAASKATGTVLELGCDGGGLTYLLCRKGCRVISGDIDRDLVKEASAWLKFRGLNNVEFVVLDAHNLPFREGSVDTITLIDVLEHLQNPVKALIEAKTQTYFRSILRRRSIYIAPTSVC